MKLLARQLWLSGFNQSLAGDQITLKGWPDGLAGIAKRTVDCGLKFFVQVNLFEKVAVLNDHVQQFLINAHAVRVPYLVLNGSGSFGRGLAQSCEHAPAGQESGDGK